MGQGLLLTKRRIQSISSTRKITKAMELVATVKLKKYKDRMQNLQSYLDAMSKIISSCASNDNPNEDIELKIFNEAKQTLYVVVTSSLGLCGGYNYNLFKYLNKFIKQNDKVLIIGSKGLSKLSNDEVDLNDDFVDIMERLDYQKVSNLRDQILSEYKTGNYRNVVLVSTLYKNSLTFTPSSYNLLPLEKLEDNKLNLDTLFEPSKEEVLSLILPKYLNTILYGRLIESLVCEQASRRNAMDNANDNAEELLEKLQIEYNKARQAAITQEITEVVAGANNI